MTMKMVATAAAVLAHAAAPSDYERCADVATKLYDFDLKLLQLTREEEVFAVDRTEEIDRLVDEAGALVKSIPNPDIELYFNDELPRHPLNGTSQGGRLRLEWVGSPWNLDNPLYFALPEDALGSNAPG